jgi:acyl transferase domain-containing protein
VASLIKVVLSLQQGLIPPSLHCHERNPYIHWDELPLAVPNKPVSWPKQTKLAGINSFGMTGTNVHMIVAEAPVAEQLQSVGRSCHLLVLSGKTGQALKDQISRYLDYLPRHPELALADVCHTANTGRVHFEHRLAVTAADMVELQAKLLKAVVAQEPVTALGKTAFLFTGQGSQYVDMGRGLYETAPLFREIIGQCDAILRQYLATPLLDVLYANNQALHQTHYTQPALFAIEYALAKLWQSWGVEPDILIGHSVGEYAAACLAGVFSLEDGLKLVAARGRLMQAMPPNGSMVAVQLTEADLAPIIQPYLDKVAVASFNAPQSLVLSGLTESIGQIIGQLEGQGIKCSRLAVSHAFHSPLMEPMLAEFGQIARSITYQAPSIKLISNITGTLISDFNADYWVQHVRQPVRFAQGMATVAGLAAEAFVEIGPKPILLGLGQLSVPGKLWLPSLYPKQHGDWRQMLESLAAWYAHGGTVDWRAFDRPYPCRKVALPTYPFQRQRYWIDQRSQIPSASGHPLLGPMFRLPNDPDIHFQSHVSANQPAYLADHRVFGQAIFPGAAFMEMALVAGQSLLDTFQISNVSFQQPLLLTEEGQTLVCSLSPLSEGYRWQLFSLLADQQQWLLHSTGEIHASAGSGSSSPLAALKSSCPTDISVKAHYQACSEQGLDYGPLFQGIVELHQGHGEALGLIRLPDLADAGSYQLHPALLDACLQVSLWALSDKTSDAYLPVALERFQLYKVGNHRSVWSYAKERPTTHGETCYVDITLLAESGELLAELTGLAIRAASRETVLGSRLRTDWLYQLAWHTAPLPEQTDHSAGHWLLIADTGNHYAAPLAELLRAKGQQVDVIGSHQPLVGTYDSVVYLGGLSPQPNILDSPPDYFPTPEALGMQLHADLQQHQGQIAFYNQLHPQLEALSSLYIWQALRQLGADLKPGQLFSPLELAGHLGVDSRYQRLFQRLLSICSEEGFLQPTGHQQWLVIRIPDEVDPGHALINILARYPVMPPIELRLLSRCGDRLADVLRGECDALQLLFPSGDLTSATQLYRDAPAQELMNTLAQTALKMAIKYLPQNRKVRILEVGGGTGGTAYLCRICRQPKPVCVYRYFAVLLPRRRAI